mgnify:CR=1 FL=1
MTSFARSQGAAGAGAAQRPEPAEPIVDMSGVRFAWGGARSFALQIDRFTLERGDRALLFGPSGSGKSTFLSLLCGTVLPQAGRISILGTDITRLSAPARDRFRAEHFGIIFQMFNLLPYGSVIENVALPLSFADMRRARAAGAGGADREARRLLASLGLEADLVDGHAASRLSVGQQQRVAAARALIGSPEIIVADEPTSALDRNRQIAILDLLFTEAEQAGAAVLMVSHDETLCSRFSRVVDLSEIARRVDYRDGVAP